MPKSPATSASQAATQAASQAARLLRPKVPSVPGTRRSQYSAATKQALVDVAEALFTDSGYAATSLDAIVAGAEVTKGALYHHFSGKQALFEAVFERIEEDAVAQINESIQGVRDPWEKANAGLHSFLEVVRMPTYRRIVIQEGPAVLGYERFREHEERSTLANVIEICRDVMNAGKWEIDEPMVETFSRIFFGALNAAGTSVVASQDPDAASERVETAIGFILAGLRSLVDAGVELPTSESLDGD